MAVSVDDVAGALVLASDEAKKLGTGPFFRSVVASSVSVFEVGMLGGAAKKLEVEELEGALDDPDGAAKGDETLGWKENIGLLVEAADDTATAGLPKEKVGVVEGALSFARDFSASGAKPPSLLSRLGPPAS